jgi:hypothetical protein
MENRKNKRFPVRFRSSFTSLNVVGGEGTLMDLSIRGCRIESRTEVRTGTSLELKIQAEEHEPPLMIQGAIVRWSRARQFGLEFITLAPEEWARLQHSVTQLELQPYQEKLSDTDPEAA